MAANSHLQEQRPTRNETEFSGTPIASLSTGTPQDTPGMQRLFQNYPSSSHTTTPSLLNSNSQNTNLTEASLTNCSDPQQLIIQQRSEQPASNIPNCRSSPTLLEAFLSRITTSSRSSLNDTSQIVLSMPSSIVNTQCTGSIDLANTSGLRNVTVPHVAPYLSEPTTSFTPSGSSISMPSSIVNTRYTGSIDLANASALRNVTVPPFTIERSVNSQQQSVGLLSSASPGSSSLQYELPRNTTSSLPSSAPNALHQTNVNGGSPLNALAEATVERGPISQEEQSASDAFDVDEADSNLQVSKRYPERETLRSLKTKFFNISEDK